MTSVKRSSDTNSLDEDQTRFDTIVVGGGQTGLVVGYELKSRGADFVVLDANQKSGDAWRNRWDSLRLFTQARMNGLPGMSFPANGAEFVTKDQVADFLDQYAEEMEIPIRNRTKVDRLHREGDDYVLTAEDDVFRARNVIVAMADYQQPFVPPFATDLDPEILQLHSSQYKNPSQLRDGGVLVVGLGNSGADIAFEVAKGHPTWVSGTESGHVPFRLEAWFGRTIGTRIVRFVMVKVLNTSTPIGRRARPKMLTKSAPLVRVRPKELETAGVNRVDRIGGVTGGLPVTEDGVVVDVANVIWCTGYKPDFEWIDLPVFEDEGRPRHERGVVPGQPGFYFCGLYFLHALWSETLTGVVTDARYVVDHLVSRTRISRTVSV